MNFYLSAVAIVTPSHVDEFPALISQLTYKLMYVTWQSYCVTTKLCISSGKHFVPLRLDGNETICFSSVKY